MINKKLLVSSKLLNNKFNIKNQKKHINEIEIEVINELYKRKNN